MELKEKCIYYNPSKDGYYLVLSISDMIYGRYGEMGNPSYMDKFMNQAGTGLRFKIDDIIIHKDTIRNYKLDEKELDKFELIKDLTDEEFYPMEILIHSNYKFPSVIIDVHKHMSDVYNMVRTIKHKESEINKLILTVRGLEKKLFRTMSK